MKRFIIVLALVSGLFLSLSSQVDTRYQNKIYKTWISSKNGTLMKGVLYEIKDSSILVSNSLSGKDYISNNFNVSEINFADINQIYIRGKSSPTVGTVIGTVLGLVAGIGIASGIGGKDEFGAAMILVGIPVVTIGAGIGAVAGLLRKYIPVKSSFENFKRNQSLLERCSYFREISTGPNQYEKSWDHKWFAGILMGVSFPSGDFLNRVAGDPNSDFTRTGGNGGFILGFNFKEKYGASACFVNGSYNVGDNSSDKWWSLSSILAGPMLTFPLGERFLFDLKPMIGMTSSSLIAGDQTEKSANGLGIYPGALLRYNFSKRWCAMTEAGYLISRQDYGNSVLKVETYNLSLGIGYRFK